MGIYRPIYHYLGVRLLKQVRLRYAIYSEIAQADIKVCKNLAKKACSSERVLRGYEIKRANIFQFCSGLLNLCNNRYHDFCKLLTFTRSRGKC